MDDEKVTTERWTYLGVFEGAQVKKLATFRTEDGRRPAFKVSANNRGLAVGHVYTVEATPTGMRGRPEWTGDKAGDYDEIRMDSLAREFVMEREALEAKARKNNPDLDALLDHVSEYAARLVKTSSKEALIALLTRAVWRATR